MSRPRPLTSPAARAPWVVLPLLVGLACADGTLKDGAGWGACELPARGCGDGQLCVEGRCTGTAPDASGGWRQRSDGFGTAAVGPGGSLSVDVSNENTLVAGYEPGGPLGAAVATFRGAFPAHASGRLTGRIRLRYAAPFAGSLTFLTVKTRSGANLVEVSVSGAQVEITSDAGVLQPTYPAINGLPYAEGFEGFQQLLSTVDDVEVRVEWKQGAFLRIGVPGDQFERTLEPPDAEHGPALEDADVSEISLGVIAYQGPMPQVGVVFTDWELTFPER